MDRYVAGLLRILAVLGMVDDDLPPLDDRPAPVHVTGSGDLDNAMAAVTSGGYFIHDVGRGDQVRVGQRLGAVHGIRGEVLEEVHADADGRVMAVKRRSRVDPGDLVVSLAREVDGP